MAGDQWDFGMARSDLSIQKIDHSGNLIWRNSFGTHSTERGFDVISNIDNGYYVLGYTRGYQKYGDIFLVKTDNLGNEIWRNTYGFNNDDYAFDLHENLDGDILIVGSKNSFYDDVHANYKEHDADIILLKIDNNGTLIWSKNYGGNNHDFGYSIETESNGGYYLAGSSQSFGNGKFDMILMKIDENGESEWQETYGGSDYEYCVAMSRNEQNDLFLIGSSKSYSNSTDIFLVKTTANGIINWSINIGGDGIDYGHDVLSTDDGGCAIIGQSQDPTTDKFNLIFVKVDADGIVEDITNTTLFSDDAIKITFGPNPMTHSGYFYNQQKNNYKVNLINSEGKLLRSFPIGEGKTKIYRDNLSPGFYTYFIIDEKGNKIVYTGKLIIY